VRVAIALLLSVFPSSLWQRLSSRFFARCIADREVIAYHLRDRLSGPAAIAGVSSAHPLADKLERAAVVEPQRLAACGSDHGKSGGVVASRVGD